MMFLTLNEHVESWQQEQRASVLKNKNMDQEKGSNDSQYLAVHAVYIIHCHKELEEELLLHPRLEQDNAS